MTRFFRSIVLLIAVTALSFSLSAQDGRAGDFSCKVDFHCANGKKLLETKLAEVPGITSFVVNLETKVIDFKFDPEVISVKGIIAEIEKIGYYTEFSDKNKEIKKACSHGSGEHHDHDHDHE
jgi:copper chaperone CopZ